MKLTLHYEDDLIELEQPAQEIQTDGITDATYQTSYGGMTRTRRVLTLGEHLVIAHTTITTPVEFVLLIDHSYQGMEMHFNLSGSAHSHFGSAKVEFQGAQHNQLFFPGFKQGIHYQAGESYACVEIDFWPLATLQERMAYQPDQLRANVERVKAGDLFALGAARPLSPAQRQILHELLNCPLTGPYRRMYLEAKVWELYALQAEQLTNVPLPSIKLSSQDIERLYQVRGLLLQSMDNPSSLLELTRLTGLNLDKLKRGFREVFGTTVFGYLHEVRMSRARELLLTGDQSIAEVAYLIGYKNPQHFTVAFRKRFGILPRQVKR